MPSKPAPSAPSASPHPVTETFQLDHGGAEPLYLQIAHRLADDISSGRLAPGAQVPSEAELMQRYGVSRITVRQAVQLLARSGQVTPRRGKGTFVARPAVSHDLGPLQGFQEALRSQGIEPEMTLLEFSASAGRVDRALPEGLVLPVRLRRRYALQGTTFAIVEAYLPEAAAQLGERRARELPVYDIVQQFLGQRIGRAEVEIRCAAPPPALARELGVAKGTNVLVMQRTSYTVSGMPCEHMRIHIVPERYTFKLSVPGPLEIARALQPSASVAVAGGTGTAPAAAPAPASRR